MALLEIDDPRYVAYSRRVFGDEPGNPFETLCRPYNRAACWWEGLSEEEREAETELVVNSGIPAVIRIDQVIAALPHCGDSWRLFSDVFPRGETAVDKRAVARAVARGLDVAEYLRIFGLEDLLKSLRNLFGKDHLVEWEAIKLWRRANGRS